MSDLQAKLLAAFRVEYREHLEHIRDALGRLDNGSGEPSELDEPLRRAHSLKGAARALGAQAIETLAHRLETLFAWVKSGDRTLDDAARGTAERVLDAIEDVGVCLGGGVEPPDTLPALRAIDVLLDAGGNGAERKADGDGEPRGSSATRSSADARVEASVERRAASGAWSGSDSVRVRTRHLDELLRSSAELAAHVGRQDEMGPRLIRESVLALQSEWERAKVAVPTARLRAEPELAALARFLGSFEQTVRELARRVGAARTAERRNGVHLRRLSAQIQADVEQARLVPAESVFEGFRKMVRDLARDEGKEVRFEASGLALVADRTVLQALKDPLMHVLRNAVTHGIEPPEERRARGKAPGGMVRFTVQTGGGRLLIEITDDGRGLDLSSVVHRAVSIGLISEQAAADEQLETHQELVFSPGLSTASAVTALAGRGMGMSVVKEAVRRLQGVVELDRLEPAGLRVRIDVPLSVTLQRLLLVECRNQSYAIPLHAIERLIRVRAGEIRTIEGQPVIEPDGAPTPIVSLGAILYPHDPTSLEVEGERFPLAILRAGARRLAVAVERLVAEVDSVVKALDAGEAASREIFSGVIPLVDGRLSLVLNPAAIMEAHASLAGRPMALGSHSPEQTRTPEIMVVDDSFTTRTLEQSVLEANGYGVRVAVDGADALKKLQSERVDLVIADVQMPNLDGFGLLEAIKKDDALKRIPVIMVTSLEDPASRERGLELGADAYVVKRKFDQQDLLQTIERML